MNQPIKLREDSYNLTQNYTDNSGALVFKTDDYLWLSAPEKFLKNSVSIEQLISQITKNPTVAKQMPAARKWVGDEFYAGEKSLRALRLSKGYSQAKLAELMGVQQPYVARIESGRVSVSVDTIKKLSTALNCQPAAILELFI